MTKLQPCSEPFAKTGNMAAEGVRRLLGSPALSPLQTLVREGLQNSLDAACDENGTRVAIRVRTLSTPQREALANQVLSGRLKSTKDQISIAESLSKPKLQVLELCDFGTEGLSGPTRADIGSSQNESSNFVNFLRNVGAARDVHQGGGTYGYGKSALYRMSNCATIVVDSMTLSEGKPVRRLMACHLGEAFEAADDNGLTYRYTGRHWWGIPDRTGYAEPATDANADELAEALGMLPRTTGETGTSILIVDLDLAERNTRQSCDDIAETILWNFWPRMARATDASRRLIVDLMLEDERIDLPAPEDFPPLDLFVAALNKIRTGSNEAKQIWCGKPRKLLGKLVIENGLCSPRVEPASREASLIPPQAHHVALMRPVELVVKYLPGDALRDPRFERAGVFVCSDENEVEKAFADSEPPAHDDWVADSLPKGHARTYVRMAYKRILEEIAPNGKPAKPGQDPGYKPSLAATATTLGSLLRNTTARGPGKSESKRNTPSSRKGVSVSTPRFDGLEPSSPNRVIARFTAIVRNNGSDGLLHLVVHPHPVADGGAINIDDLPQGMAPKVLSIRLKDSDLASDTTTLDIGSHEGEVEVRVEAASDTVTGLKLALRPKGIE